MKISDIKKLLGIKIVLKLYFAKKVTENYKH